MRRLATGDQFIALLYGQLAGAQSLREIESGLASHAHRLYHLGTRSVSRSTLADANATRPSEVFGALFAHLVAQAGRGLRRKIGEAVHLIDSTGLRLSELSADWARFSDGVCGAKLHIFYDCDAERPIDRRHHARPAQRHHRRPGSADSAGSGRSAGAAGSSCRT